MIDARIANLVNEIETAVEKINENMAILHEDNVEIRILYKESSSGNPAKLDLWRAIEHVNYLNKSE